MKKSARWATLLATVVALGVALVAVFVLTLATSGGLAERHFVWLFWVNVAVAALLLVVVVGAALRLARRLRAGRFGSRLLARLAGIFALVGLVPGLLIYAVSYQFVTRSVDSWFDTNIATALDAGLALGRGTLDTMAQDLAKKTRMAAEHLADARGSVGPLELERVRVQLGVRDVVLLGPTGQVLASVGGSNAALVPERPAQLLLRQARERQSASALEGLDDEPAPGARPATANARVRALAVLPSPDIRLGTGGEERFLMAVQPIAEPLVANALQVQAAYREYQQRALAREGLRRMYVGTLTLALVLSVFGAVLLAGTLGHQIVRPLLLLADGVRQVADGDLTAKPVFASNDELGGLTRSFAQMTEQLADARAQVQRGVAQMEGARTRLQTILDSLSAGVIVLDREGRIDTVNPGATRILRQPVGAWRGRELADVPGLAELAAAERQRSELHRVSPEAGERDHWQDALELPLGGPGAAKGDGTQAGLNLLLRGAPLPGGARLLVFDDITEVVSAQRSVAWAEVARRLAHEIKNPLTPIQLSAERIEHKLAPRLEGADRSMLQRSVATIVAQVQAMKRLVDEFRDYARLPAARLAPLDLNALVHEVLALYAPQQEQGRLRAHLADDVPPIEGDATQLRQVVHNLVQNALDAVADKPDGCVEVSTEAAHGDTGLLRAVRLKVADNGGGFTDKVLKRAFEPYITTKSKGTGLGLAVVKKIADEHGARVRIVNKRALADGDVAAATGAEGDGPVTGAQVSLSFSRFALAQPLNIPPAPPPWPAPHRPDPSEPGAALAGTQATGQ